MDTGSIVAIIAAVFASGGFWAFLTSRFQSHDNRRDKEDKELGAMKKMIKGLGHDRIIFLCDYYLDRGYITTDEYENLHDYLYIPYVELGGNGTAKNRMQKVDLLPNHPPNKEANNNEP